MGQGMQDFFGDNGPWRGSKNNDWKNGGGVRNGMAINEHGYAAQSEAIEDTLNFFGFLSIFSAWLVDPILGIRQALSDHRHEIQVDRLMGNEAVAELKSKGISARWFNEPWPFPAKIGVKPEDREAALKTLDMAGLRIHRG